MKRLKGFTLIELLIVVAIIAILAAIAVPNFLEAQIRSKVSRAKTDMRTLATALETYFVDNNTYVGSGTAPTDGSNPGMTVNSKLAAPSANNAAGRITFRNYTGGFVPNQAQSMTTPVAYLTSIPADPFADTKGASFGYFNAADAGWIAWSYGPDTDEKNANGQIQKEISSWTWTTAGTCDFAKGGTAESFYTPYLSNPTSELLAGPEGATYDPTNGTNSGGDVWRVKQ